MRPLAALALTLLTANGRAATAYVTDELILGVFAEPNGQGQRLTTLHSGATVETVSVAGDYTQVRLADGVSGWVKTAYLMSTEPATVRLKQVQDELDRSQATTPGLAEAAERAEVVRLQGELADLRAARQVKSAPVVVPQAAATHGSGGLPWVSALAVIVALLVGFYAGYTTLARHIKHRFGGIKVY